MNILDIVILGIALSMDAFAVAVCKGLAVDKAKIKHCLIAGVWFGGFQGLMPAIGFVFGSTFAKYIEKYDHWVGFILLALIGVNMIKEALSKEEQNECHENSFAAKTMFVMAVATSVDALAVGITFPTSFGITSVVDVIIAVLIIGILTFILSAIGVKIGNIFGTKYKSKAEVTGGVILILLGIKILLEGLNIVSL